MRYVEKTGTIFVRANFPEETMSKKCENCGKIPQVGHHVSHSNIKTNRRFNPNLQTVRHQTPEGTVRRITLCTRCIRSGAVTKPLAQKKQDA